MKKILCFILTLLLCLSLVACGDPDNNDQGNQDFAGGGAPVEGPITEMEFN